MYLAFAVAMGARGVVVSDGPFVRDMRTHPDPALAAMLIPLDEWARSNNAAWPAYQGPIVSVRCQPFG